jgi:hypothetical protein
MAESGLPSSRVLRDLIATDQGPLLNRYKYPPLPAKSIRILALTPGQQGTELHGRIIIHDPDEVNYGALSYVWGDSRLTKSIHIGEATLSITESLYFALQQIRETDEEHWIWCDQICIDQESLADRSEQVGRMGEVYGKADHVIAWFGSATPATDYIFRSLGKVGDGANPGFYSYLSEELEPGQPVYESMIECLNAELRTNYHNGEDPPDFEEVTREAVQTVLRNPWFERTWTVQEAVLCEKLFLQAGDLELTWRKFCGFLKAMPDLPRPKAIHYDLELTRSFCCYGSKEISLYGLVDNYQMRQATDPRDKIYGLMGLLDPERRRPVASAGVEMEHVSDRWPRPLPEVDYSKTTEEVYMDFTLWCIHTSEDLEALRRCCIEYRHSKDLQLPSWARDWTQKLGPVRCGYLIGTSFDDSTEPFTASLDLKAQVRRLQCFSHDWKKRKKGSSEPGAEFVGTDSVSGPTNVSTREALPSLINSAEDTIMHVLLVKGLEFDIIEETVHRVHMKGSVGNNQSETWQEWKHFAMKDRPPDRDQYPGHQSRIDALWRTLINDQRGIHDERAGPEVGEHFETMLYADTTVSDASSAEDKGSLGESGEENPEEEDDRPNLSDWLYDHDTTLLGRKLFRTEKGYLGMTCPHVRAGDKVCVLWGGRLPFVLREKCNVVLTLGDSEDPQVVMSHVLIGGECYVHGLADGEAVETARREQFDAGEICIV